jgi:hypothetical protein
VAPLREARFEGVRGLDWLDFRGGCGGCGFGSGGAEAEVGAEGVVDARCGGGAEVKGGLLRVGGGRDDAERLVRGRLVWWSLERRGLARQGEP